MKFSREYIRVLISHKFYFFVFLICFFLIIIVIIFGLFISFQSIKKPTQITALKTSHLSDYSVVKKNNNVVFLSLHTDSGYLYKAQGVGLDAAKDLIQENPVLDKKNNVFPKNIVDTFQVKDIIKDSDDPYLKKNNIRLTNEHIVFTQSINGVPILASQLTIHLRNENEIYDISGSWITNTKIENETILEQQAKDIAITQAKKSYKSDKDLVVAHIERYIVNLNLLGISHDENNYPTYKILVENQGIPTEFSTEYFVSRTTGKIIFTENKMNNLLDRQIYDCEKNPNCSKKLVRSEGNSPSNISDADKAYDLFEEVYNYFKIKHNRDSLDNNGMPLKAYVNLGSPACPNAAWHDTEMLFCPGMVQKDITAHEMTHGIVQNTVNLIPYYQALSINESIADFFASAIDHNWTIGEGSPIGIVRNMQDPTSVIDDPKFGPQPDTLFSSNYYCGVNDIGGGHHNNGVINKSFYLMVEGGTFNGCTFQGIGREKAEAIVYRVLNARYIPTNANFYDLYSGILKSCADLFQGTSPECQNVKKALQSTEIDQQAVGYIIGASCGGAAYPEYTPSCRPDSQQNKNSTESHENNSNNTQPQSSSTHTSLTGLSIRTDKSEYEVHDKIHVCYQVPKSDYVEISTVLPGQVTAVISEGVDEGQGDCFDGIVNQPSGEQCVRITYGHSDVYTAEACFTVKDGNASSVNTTSTGKKGISPLTDPFDGTQDEKIYYECHDSLETKIEGGKQIQVSGLKCERTY